MSNAAMAMGSKAEAVTPSELGWKFVHWGLGPGAPMICH